MTAEAAQWLFERKVKAVAYDFPQDYCIRHYVLNDRKPQYAENVTHTALLVKGVVMFEYLRNFRAISTPRTLFIGLPLKLENADGAPVRAIALQL
jgi:arylformamidase